jgi:hypothetical protein
LTTKISESLVSFHNISIVIDSGINLEVKFKLIDNQNLSVKCFFSFKVQADSKIRFIDPKKSSWITKTCAQLRKNKFTHGFIPISSNNQLFKKNSFFLLRINNFKNACCYRLYSQNTYKNFLGYSLPQILSYSLEVIAL